MQIVPLHSVCVAAAFILLEFQAQIGSSLSPKLSLPSCLVAELPDHTAILPMRWVEALLCIEQNHVLSGNCSFGSL